MYYLMTMGFLTKQNGPTNYDTAVIKGHPLNTVLEFNSASNIYTAWLVFAMEISEEQYLEAKKH